MRLQRILATLLFLSLAASLPGCLKTRSQIKSGSETDGAASEEVASATAKRYELEEMKNEFTRLSGKVEEIEHAQRAQNATETKDQVAKLDGRISEIEKNQILIMSELKEIKDRQTSAAAATKEAATPSTDLLSQGNKLLKEKKFEEAAEKFKAVLNKNPKGKEAADAHFGLGETEYGQKNYKRAIVQYSKVQEVQPKSGRVPTSLYKIGLAFQHLNMSKEASGFFSEIIERFPKSPEAKKSRPKIKD